MRTFLLSIIILLSLIIGLILIVAYLEESASIEKQSRIPGQENTPPAQSLNFFEKMEKESDYQLKYGWKDYQGEKLYVSFAISKKQLSESEDEFGYYPEELQKYVNSISEEMTIEMISYLKEFVRQQIGKTRYSQYILIEEIDAKTFTLKLSVPAPLHKKVKPEFDKIKEKLAQEKEKYLKNIEKEVKKRWKAYLEERGVRLIADKISVNYEFCVRRNQPRMSHVLESLRKIKANSSLREFLDLLLAYIQEIRYGIPPLEENKKAILEFWVPPKVLVNNFGDCDSKGVTFASLWTNFRKYPLLLIKIPKHLFVGIALPSLGEETITLNGIRYIFCEVAGPEKIPSGLLSPYSQFYLQSRHYFYEIID